eukprot:29120-Pelagococcus_subviridis.AAC.25
MQQLEEVVTAPRERLEKNPKRVKRPRAVVRHAPPSSPPIVSSLDEPAERDRVHRERLERRVRARGRPAREPTHERDDGPRVPDVSRRRAPPDERSRRAFDARPAAFQLRPLNARRVASRRDQPSAERDRDAHQVHVRQRAVPSLHRDAESVEGRAARQLHGVRLLYRADSPESLSGTSGGVVVLAEPRVRRGDRPGDARVRDEPAQVLREPRGVSELRRQREEQRERVRVRVRAVRARVSDGGDEDDALAAVALSRARDAVEIASDGRVGARSARRRPREFVREHVETDLLEFLRDPPPERVRGVHAARYPDAYRLPRVRRVRRRRLGVHRVERRRRRAQDERVLVHEKLSREERERERREEGERAQDDGRDGVVPH